MSMIKDKSSHHAHIKSRERFLKSLGQSSGSSREKSGMGKDLRYRIFASRNDSQLVQDTRFVCSKNRDEFETWHGDRDKDNTQQIYRFADSFTSALKAVSRNNRTNTKTTTKITSTTHLDRIHDSTIRNNMNKIIKQRRNRFFHTERPNPITDARDRMEALRYEFERTVLGPCLLSAIREEPKSETDLFRLIRTAHSALTCRTKRRGGIPTQCTFLPNTQELQDLMKRCQQQPKNVARKSFKS